MGDTTSSVGKLAGKVKRITESPVQVTLWYILINVIAGLVLGLAIPGDS